MKPYMVRHEELDTPLCEVFSDAKAKGTARQWVKITEFVLGVRPCDLDKMKYKEMNEYMDSLEKQLAKVIV